MRLLAWLMTMGLVMYMDGDVESSTVDQRRERARMIKNQPVIERKKREKHQEKLVLYYTVSRVNKIKNIEAVRESPRALADGSHLVIPTLLLSTVNGEGWLIHALSNKPFAGLGCGSKPFSARLRMKVPMSTIQTSLALSLGASCPKVI